MTHSVGTISTINAPRATPSRARGEEAKEISDNPQEERGETRGRKLAALTSNPGAKLTPEGLGQRFNRIG